jgi:hypothetical protein
MKSSHLDRVVNAILYEGHILYPCRVYPNACGDSQNGAVS